MEAGMDDYVTKPLDPKVLFAALDRWTEHKTSPELAEVGKAKPDSEDYSKRSDEMLANIDMGFEDGLFGEPAQNPQSQKDVSMVEPEPIDPNKPPLDLDDAMPRFFNDQSFFNEMCHDLVVSIPTRMLEIRSDIETNNVNELYRHAHNLKGVSSNFSAGPVSSLAARMEMFGKNGDLPNAAILVEQLEVEAERLIDYCVSKLGV
jgi:HPt (histidine-containing phosphotransfer) domain-containing protein